MIGELDLNVYDIDLNLVAVVDQYKSLIWTDRYNECGDFELVVPYRKDLLALLKCDNFCHIVYSPHWAVIEKVEVKKDEDEPPELVVSGRSAECILERRVVCEKVEFENANLQSSIYSLLDTNIINPSDEKRRIDDFSMNESVDSAVSGLTFTQSYDGDDLLNIISGLCQANHIGFIIRVSDSGGFVFQLYAGKNRSISKTVYSPVIFSPYYDNLLNSSYCVTTEDFRNVMVVSKDASNYLVISSSDSGYASGLRRREIQTDIDSLKDNKSSSISNSVATAKARQKLQTEHKVKSAFEGDIVPDVLFSYIDDYFTGDIVSFTDVFGNSHDLRIMEMVISKDENGLEMIPGFEELEE